MAAVEFRKVDIIFGKKPEAAVKLLDEGADRDAILEQTGNVLGVADASIAIEEGEICGRMGLSGSGKSTLIRGISRLVEPTAGRVAIEGEDILSASKARMTELRRSQIGMVFQRPNPLPISIRDNVLFGFELHGEGRKRMHKSEKDEIAEQALRQVLLWDEVKDRLDQKATELSLEEQQKLCIARLIPVKPSVLLMDEPCSALDPKGTAAVEELIWELRGEYTILIVTHNMAQARRASEECIFMLLGKVIEHTATEDMFVTPEKQETADYIEGRYG